MSLETLQEELLLGSREAAAEGGMLELPAFTNKLDEAFASAMKGDLKALGRYMIYIQASSIPLPFEENLANHTDSLRFFKLRRRVEKEIPLLTAYFKDQLSEKEAAAVAKLLLCCREFISRSLAHKAVSRQN